MEECAPVSNEKAWRNSCLVGFWGGVESQVCNRQQLAAKNRAYGILQGFATVFFLMCESIGHFSFSVG